MSRCQSRWNRATSGRRANVTPWKGDVVETLSPALDRLFGLRLRHGLAVGGMTYGDAKLRALCGLDELLLEESDGVPAALVTRLLANVITSIGAVAPIDPTHIRQLTIGDRERLLLGLYAGTFGAHVDTLIACDACHAVTEVPLDLIEALGDVREPSASEGVFTLDSKTIRFRVLTGADQERAAAATLENPDAGAATLLGACLNDVTATDAPGRLQSALEDALHAADPDADSEVVVPCATCGGMMRGVLDGFALLRDTLRPGPSVLEDVDRLAAAYHWTETAILSLPTERRRRYIALLDRRAAA